MQRQSNAIHKRQCRLDNKQTLQSMGQLLAQVGPMLAEVDFASVDANLSNFIFLQEKFYLPFFAQLKSSLLKKLHELATQATVSRSLDMLSFWMDCYYRLLQSIAQCSEASTLQAMKQESLRKRSTRKGWSEQETDKLQREIRKQGQVGFERANELAQEMGRSLYSVQSKIQKLLRVNNVIEERHKDDNYTLENKILTVLKRFSEGLPKDQVIAELEKVYEMGEQPTWKKSVGQLLCSSENVRKLKGTYRLSQPVSDRLPSDTTYKYRTIRCLLELPKNSGTLRQILDKYLELFTNDQEISPNRRKSIEAGVAKVLKRCSDFDRRNCKTRYCYTESRHSLPQELSSAQEEPSEPEENSVMSP